MILPNQTVEGYMTVQKGATCGMRLMESRGGIETSRLTRPPSAGKATVDHTRILYVPKPDYIGADSFTFESSGPDFNGRPATYGVLMHVKVVP